MQERNYFFTKTTNKENSKNDLDEWQAFLDDLIDSDKNTILENITKVIKLIKDPAIYSLFSNHFDLVWKKLITQHSDILSEIGCGLGRQTYSVMFNPFLQLLGIYYLALALVPAPKNTNSEKFDFFEEETTQLLEEAALNHSVQAILLLRVLYLRTLLSGEINFDLKEFQIIIKNFSEQFRSPSHIFYGEMLMYISMYHVKTRSQIYKNINSSPLITYSQISTLFAEGVLHCYIGDFLQSSSSIEINNAYGVTDGVIPYTSGQVFYGNESYESMDDFCRTMRKRVGLPVDIETVKNLAKQKVELMSVKMNDQEYLPIDIHKIDKSILKNYIKETIEQLSPKRLKFGKPGYP